MITSSIYNIVWYKKRYVNCFKTYVLIIFDEIKIFNIVIKLSITKWKEAKEIYKNLKAILDLYNEKDVKET